MSFLLDESTNGVVAPPMSTPQVDIPALAPGLPVCQFDLIAGHVLVMPYLCLHFIQYKTLGFVERVNSGLPIVYVGIYYQTLMAGDAPAGRPIDYIGLDVPGVISMPRPRNVVFTAPGVYRVMLVNNHASSTISALVTGTSQLLNVKTNS